MEAMKITSDAIKKKLVAFHLEDESQVWWYCVKALRDLEAMTWEEFRGLFMGKFFLAFDRHAKAREFLELKQGMMTVLEYVAKFTYIAHFADDYVATYMARVRKFEDLMVKTAMAIEREVDDAWNIRDADVKDKRKEIQPSSSSSGKKHKTSTSQGFKGQGRGY